MPLKEDYEENEPVFEMLVGLYQQQNQTVFAVTGRVLPVLEKVLDEPEEQLDDKTRGNVIELLRFLRSKDEGIFGGYPLLAQLAN